MLFKIFKRKGRKDMPKETIDNSLSKSIGDTIIRYHVDESGILPNGQSKIIIDSVSLSPSLQRSKELINKLSAKDKHGDFKTECIRFQNDLKDEVKKITSMVDSFSEKINKYMSNTNVI